MFSVSCDKCGTRMDLDEARVPPSGMVKKCTQCGEPVTVMPPAQLGPPAAKPMPPRPAATRMGAPPPPLPAAAARPTLGKGPALAAFESDALELEPSELTDLPAPATRSKFARTQGLGSADVDLPAPVRRGGGDLPDLLAPVGGPGLHHDDEGVDLPAPVQRHSDLPDLLAPLGPADDGLPDLLAPVGPSTGALPDLLAPVGRTGSAVPDLLAPVGPTGSNVPDLLSPVGPSGSRVPDLLSPVGPTSSRTPDLLSPVGPTSSKTPDLLSPVGPTSTRGLDLPAPKGFLDDAPPPAAKPGGGFSLDFDPPAAPSGPPGMTKGMPADDAGLDMLDLSPPGDGGKSGPGGAPDLLSFDAPSGGVPLPPAGGGVVSFGKVEPKAPSASALSMPPPMPAAPPKTGGGAGVLDLDTATDPAQAAKVAKKVAKDRDDKAKAKQAAVEDPEARARARKKRMIALGVVGLLLAGGGAFYFFWQRAAEQEQIQATHDRGVSEARKALATSTWERAYSSAQQAVGANGKSQEGLGLAAQAQLAWAIDTGRDVQVHRKLADDLLKRSLTGGVSGEEVERAKALLLVVDARAQDAVQAMGKLRLTDPVGSLYKGWISLAAGNYDVAKTACTSALAGKSGKDANRSALYCVGRAKLALGDSAGAEAAFDDLLKAQPNHIGALVGKAALIPRDRQGTREKRLMEILSGGELDKASPADITLAWTLAGQEALYARRWDDAEVRFKKAEAMTPDALDAVTGRGLALLGRGNLSEAKSTLEAVKSRAAGNVDALLGLGKIARAEGRVNEAKDLLGQVAKLRPEDSDVQYELGEVLVAASDNTAALAAYEKAVSIDKSNYKAVVALANLQFKLEQRDKAIQTLSLIEKEAQGDAFLSNTLAYAYYTSGRNDDAEKWARAALAAEPGNVDAELTLALVLEKKGDAAGALAALEAGHLSDPTREDVSLRLARGYSRAGRRDDAERTLGALLVEAGDKKPSIAARSTACRFFALIKDANRAGQQAQAILAEEPTNAAGLFCRGIAALEGGKVAEALTDFTTSSTIDPDPQTFEALGRAYIAGNQYDEATSAFDNAIARDKAYIDPFIGKAKVNIFKREWDLAIKDLTQAQKLGPDRPEVWVMTGDALRQAGKHKDAIAAFKTGLKLLKDARSQALSSYAVSEAKAHYMLGVTYYELGDHAGDAIGELNEALRQQGDPADWIPDAYLKLGYAYRAVQNKGGMCKAFEKFVDAAPAGTAGIKDVQELLQGC